jgi:GDP-L-fucose synthase
MDINSKIYVAGHHGLVGSAIVRELKSKGFNNLVVRSRSELDLTDQKLCENFFNDEKPDYVILAAAKVGGIYANSNYPADFIYNNLAIQNNIIHFSYLSGVKKMIFLGSSCIYPSECEQPIKEDYLLSGKLEFSNRPYALSKISGIEMCSSYNRQHNTNFLAIMPCNLYGINDNYHQANSHVIPALIRKFHEAKLSNQKSVTLWGSGKPLREFLYSNDLANAIIFILNLKEREFKSLLFPDNKIDKFPCLNIGSSHEISIFNLSILIKDIVGFNGEIIFDQSKLDGTYRKLLDSSRIASMGWNFTTTLRDGIIFTYEDFKLQQL